MYKYFLVIGCVFWMNVIKAQELRARVTVITTRVSNNINKNGGKSGLRSSGAVEFKKKMAASK